MYTLQETELLKLKLKLREQYSLNWGMLATK